MFVVGSKRLTVLTLVDVGRRVQRKICGIEYTDKQTVDDNQDTADSIIGGLV